ncbi:MAG TPA: hypothetical protein VM325_07675 [Alphaproteobacteria bacterium]|nr:hypothetical protein [Alphaproteobacteria bacterium]
MPLTRRQPRVTGAARFLKTSARDLKTLKIDDRGEAGLPTTDNGPARGPTKLGAAAGAKPAEIFNAAFDVVDLVCIVAGRQAGLLFCRLGYWPRKPPFQIDQAIADDARSIHWLFPPGSIASSL